MATNAEGRTPGLPTLHSFRIDLRMDVGARTATVRIGGDLDLASVPMFESVVTTATEHAERVVVMCSQVKVFGSHASRAVEQLLDDADRNGCDLSFEAIPTHIRHVLELVGIGDDRLRYRRTDPALAIGDVQQVLSRSVLRGDQPVMVTTADAQEPRILFVNAAFTEMTGHRAEHVLGQPATLLSGPLTASDRARDVAESIDDSGHDVGDEIVYRADGSPFVMQWHTSQIEVGEQQFWVAQVSETTRSFMLSRQLRASRIFQDAIAGLDQVEVSNRRKTLADALGAALVHYCSASDAQVDFVQKKDATAAGAMRVGPVELDQLGKETGRMAVDFASGAVAGRIRVEPVHPDRFAMIEESFVTRLVGQFVSLCGITG